MPTDTAALRKLLAEATPERLRTHPDSACDITADGNNFRIMLARVYGGEALAAQLVTRYNALPSLLDELDLLREVAAAAGEYREAMIDSGRATNEDFPVKAARIMRAMKAIDAALARLREAGR